MTKVRVNPPIVRARMPQDRRTTPKQATLEKCESYITCEKFNNNSHMEVPVDRLPKPAAFPVGTVVEQVSERRSWWVAKDGTHVPSEAPGMRVTVDEVRPGRRGTLRQLDEDDAGDPILDTTRDGYSVWHAEHKGERFGRIIWPERANEWRVVS